MCRSRFGTTVPALFGLSLLPWTIVCALAQDREHVERRSPNGLVVVLPPGKEKERLEIRALKNPFISGIAVQMNWRDIQPLQGQPDWAKLDTLFAVAERDDKWVHLLIFSGFFAPAWAKEGAETELFPIQYGPGKGTIERLPMPWDRVYLRRWFAFLRLLSERYGRSPAFRMIAAAGPTSVSAEMTLPNKPEDHQRWIAHSYTVAKYLAAWHQVFQYYAGCFPNQFVSLSGPGLPVVVGRRRMDPEERMRARTEIVHRATDILGKQLAIQFSDLHAGHVAVEAPDETGFVRSYSGRIVTGLQMRCSAEGDSTAMGAEGDPPLALRRAIDKGMQLNDAGKRVNYLEIYEKDVLPEEMQPVLEYGASLFLHNPPSRP